MNAQASIAARRRLTQAELDMLIASHEKFLQRRPGGKRASLRFVDLSGLDLSRRDLTEADLSASILEGSKLIRTKLDGADLFGCDLRMADLRQASMVKADLRGVCLRGANLSGADLTRADFREGLVAVPNNRRGLDINRHESASARRTKPISPARP